ncbi:hypothetical protein ml_230 [Mollivirus sibericum]|uniref:hypothetical protein n=1 Tax=Mollivirus sibericum TaxID=1678078 RepID=UPI0006B2DC63|nr:hypothetical protein ml_230 [Mollivirus sibericum]ALD62032.1 hypothetical protein ml_230 [Mollivirus sibericum]
MASNNMNADPCRDCLQEKNRSKGKGACAKERIYEPRSNSQYLWCDDETLAKLKILADQRLVSFEYKKEKKGNTICISPDDEVKKALKSAGISLAWKDSQ